MCTIIIFMLISNKDFSLVVPYIRFFCGSLDINSSFKSLMLEYNFEYNKFLHYFLHEINRLIIFGL